MSGFIVQIAALVYLLVFIYSRQSSAASMAAGVVSPSPLEICYKVPVVNLPDDPNDPYYNRYQTVHSTEYTATHFVTSFLGISSTNRRRRRTTRPTDNVMVIDGSQSVGSCEFNRGKVALKNAMLAADNNNRDEKYAAITFSRSARVNFKFLPYLEAKEALTRIPYPNGWTNTQAGLAKAKELFEDSSAGWRVFSRKVILLITDGQSNIKRHLTIPNADKLKNMGVEIFVVAVGSYINGIGEIVKVAGSSYRFMRPEDYLFRVRDYNEFLNVAKLVVKKVSGKHVPVIPYSSTC